MTTLSIEDIKRAVTAIVEQQAADVAVWHEAEPGDLPEPQPAADLDVMTALAVRQSQINYFLWHVEDEARRTDVDDSDIADCKRRIDAHNQRRNDLIERVDACLVGLVGPLLPADASDRFNTETVGSALDRLSIMALKVYHMGEQAERADVDDEHRSNCAKKLAVLEEQRADLAACVLELLDEYAAGTKRPKVYYQFKMYNDPKLNPSLYAPKSKA